MEETENQSSTEVEVALPSDEIQQDSTPVETKTETQPEDSDWIKNLRRDRKEAIRRAEEAENRSKMQEELLQRIMTQQPIKNAPVEEDILSEIAQQEYVAGDKVVKGFKKLEDNFNKKLQQIEDKYRENTKNTLFDSVKSQYADFDQVVNSETLDLIEETNPRLAASLLKTMKEDPYSFGVQSYEYIKAKGLSKSTSKRASETDQRIEQNKKTVQSPQAFEKRPMAQAFDANRLSPDQKKALQQEMYQYAGHVGMGY